LRADIGRLALRAEIGGRPVRDIARDALSLARAGLAARGRLDGEGQSEARYLAPVGEIVESGRTQAERLLALYHGPWQGSVMPAFREFVF
jgi:glutamate--cysteine ligase